MRDITRRLNKAEKALRIEEPHLVTLLGVEMSSADFDRLLKEIRAESKGLPIREGTAV
jgi:hypothetical protein